jgi:hypothetical protein
MAHEVRADVWTYDMSDPFAQFCQVGISVKRSDGTRLCWRGERILQERESRGTLLNEAIASAVARMLDDTVETESKSQVSNGA